MRTLISFLFLLSFIAVNLLAQDEFQLNVDYASFYSTDSVSKVEVYYSFPQDYMKSYVDKKDNQIKVDGDLNIEITDLSNQNTLLDKNWSFTYGVDSTKNDITGQLSFRLSTGNYIFKLIGKDLTDESISDSAQFEVNVEPKPQKRFSISDIQVAGNISKSSNQKSIFWKNTYEVVPKPNGLFGSGVGQPVLFFYSEFYNIDRTDEPENLKVEHYLYNANNVQKYRKTKFIPRENNSVVEVGLINVTDYPSGIYSLVVAVSDTVIDKAVTSTKKVYLYNPDVEDTIVVAKEENAYLTSEFAVMSMEELNSAYEKLTYIAGQTEKSSWDELDSKKAKRKFLYDFWKRRDTVQATARNEVKEVYYQRVAEANQKFGKYKKGWKTDQGRVYILYGSPSDIERHPNMADTVPYEIWRYDNIEGGVKFVFADYSGIDSYRLIHSDKTGELSNPSWRRDIRN